VPGWSSRKKERGCCEKSHTHRARCIQHLSLSRAESLTCPDPCSAAPTSLERAGALTQPGPPQQCSHITREDRSADRTWAPPATLPHHSRGQERRPNLGAPSNAPTSLERAEALTQPGRPQQRSHITREDRSADRTWAPAATLPYTTSLPAVALARESSASAAGTRRRSARRNRGSDRTRSSGTARP